jgi:ADP-heptose:LPS heptosyltransferase
VKSKKKLIIRLSSLGDVILATAALGNSSANPCVDWLVKKEFSEILKGHPQIRTLWIYDRQTGIRGWFSLLNLVFNNEYEEIIDLQNSFRTHLARLFWILKTRGPNRWFVAPKQRWRLYGFFVFKALWPSSLRPRSRALVFAETAASGAAGRVDFTHLLKQVPKIKLPTAKNYICVMPSSRWENKEWPTAHYLDWIQRTGIYPVILGAQNDKASHRLASALLALEIPHQNEIGKANFVDLAHLFKNSSGFVGGDTGLFHLAESLGTRCAVFFGPTHPEQGFGPLKPETTVVLEKNLLCRPCGKDGRFCYRFFDQKACLNSVTPKDLENAIGFSSTRVDP